MSNIAILVGNSDYRTLDQLSCCIADLRAFNETLKATGRYNEICVVENENSDDLKVSLRNVVARASAVDELLFYFTGHGYISTEFFFCATNFDTNRPNQTGLSNSELHTILRGASAELTVKVIDACNSGTSLIKADYGFTSQHQQEFKSFIQISSCLASQNALTGDPLSMSTEKFIASAVQRTTGPVLYADIISALKDEFLGNELQIPHFVTQGTGRDHFANDARCFDELRAQLFPVSTSPAPDTVREDMPPIHMTLQAALLKAESNLATPEQIALFVDKLFDGLAERALSLDLRDVYALATTDHADFVEPSARQFIIDILVNQERLDNFVSAKATRRVRKPRWAPTAAAMMLSVLDEEVGATYDYELDLNYAMPRVQMRLTLTPLLKIPRKLVFVVTCAPSLDNCYVFEVGTRYALTSFSEYDTTGFEIVRRWFKIPWTAGAEGVQQQIASSMKSAIQQELTLARRFSSSFI